MFGARYAKVNADGKVEVINTLGLGGQADQASLFDKLEKGTVAAADIDSASAPLRGSDTGYRESLCQVNSSDVARYTALIALRFRTSSSSLAVY